MNMSLCCWAYSHWLWLTCLQGLNAKRSETTYLSAVSVVWVWLAGEGEVTENCRSELMRSHFCCIVGFFQVWGGALFIYCKTKLFDNDHSWLCFDVGQKIVKTKNGHFCNFDGKWKLYLLLLLLCSSVIPPASPNNYSLTSLKFPNHQYIALILCDPLKLFLFNSFQQMGIRCNYYIYSATLFGQNWFSVLFPVGLTNSQVMKTQWQLRIGTLKVFSSSFSSTHLYIFQTKLW